MAKRSQRAEEAAFERGEIGVDGLATEETQDEEALERVQVAEQLVRGRSYLGREFLTWLLWRSNAGGPVLDHDGEPLTVLLVGRITLRGLAGEATELVVKGAMSPYARIVRQAIAQGLLVHAARLRLSHGEKLFEATVDAEHLAIRSAQLPKVLSEEADDKISERLYLTEQVTALIEALLRKFLEVRTGKTWRSKTVKELRAWLDEA